MSSTKAHDTERIERIEGKVDLLANQVSELRTDTAVLVTKFDADSKQRHDEAMASSRRTKMLVSAIGVIISAVITLGSQLGWLTARQAASLDTSVKQVQSSL